MHPSSVLWVVPLLLSSVVSIRRAKVSRFFSPLLFSVVPFSFYNFVTRADFFFSLNTLGLGAAYGTAKSGVGLSAMGVLRPDLVLKCIVPVVMAGILGIYGVVVSVLLSSGRKLFTPVMFRLKVVSLMYNLFFLVAMKQTLFSGFIQMAAGLSVGLSCLAGKERNDDLYSHYYLLIYY